MSTKERLHQLIEEMNDDQAAVLLLDLEEISEPLTPEDIASIERGRSQLRAGKGIPHEEAMRRLGVAD